MKTNMPPRLEGESDDEYEDRLEDEIERRGEAALYRLKSILAKLQEHCPSPQSTAKEATNED